MQRRPTFLKGYNGQCYRFYSGQCYRFYSGKIQTRSRVSGKDNTVKKLHGLSVPLYLTLTPVCDGQTF
jgi:hypothetical protein